MKKRTVPHLSLSITYLRPDAGDLSDDYHPTRPADKVYCAELAICRIGEEPTRKRMKKGLGGLYTVVQAHTSLWHTHTHDLGCGSEPARRVPKANARAAAAAASVGLGPGLGLGLGLGLRFGLGIPMSPYISLYLAPRRAARCRPRRARSWARGRGSGSWATPGQGEG